MAEKVGVGEAKAKLSALLAEVPTEVSDLSSNDMVDLWRPWLA
jgi:hypothetical protein